MNHSWEHSVHSLHGHVPTNNLNVKNSTTMSNPFSGAKLSVLLFFGTADSFCVRQVQNVGVHLLEMKESGAKVSISLFLGLGKYKT